MAKQPTRRQPKVREVTLFLMNAAEISAVVSAFSPVKKKLRVELREPWGHREPGRYKLKIDQIACVAFPRPKGVPPSKPADQPGLHEYKVHIVGGIQFSVRVKSAQLDNPVGFWGRAVVENHPFPKVFFYRHGVEVIEEAQRLGSLLVKQGAVDSEQLRRGLEAQRQVRSRLVEDDPAQLEPTGELPPAPFTGFVVGGDSAMETLVQLPEGLGEEGLVNSAQDQRRLGSLLLEHGLVAPSVVGEALEISRGQVGKRLGEVLVDMGAIHERTLAMVLARKFRMPFVDLLEYRVGSEAVRLIPAHTARELRALPIQVNKHSVTVAVTDPLDLEGRATLRFLL